MPLVNAGTAAPDSGTGSIAANDGDGNLHGEQSKLVAISYEGKQKQACAADCHGSGSGSAPHVAKKMKRNVASSRLATADDDVSRRLRRRLLEIKKRGLEVEEQMLALERRRLRWAADAEARREEEDAELEKMRVENGRARAENARLWRRLLRRLRERELGGVRSKREEKGRDGAAAMEGEEKPVP
uniref:No apical meristem-associated C-terminal domain-containing protein n=1 Tax=Oryza punctata TaxID=4537 RepID=A0A0E0KQK0_ORYPU